MNETDSDVTTAAEIYAREQTRSEFAALTAIIEDEYGSDPHTEWWNDPVAFAIQLAAETMGYETTTHVEAGDAHIIVGFEGSDALPVKLTALHATAARVRSNRNGYGVTFDRYTGPREFQQAAKFRVYE